MQHYDYLIIGGGMAADAAARGIRELDGEGSVGIFSADVDPPYTRPALTKKLWTDPDFTWDQVPLRTQDDTGADLRLDTLVTSMDPVGRTVRTEAGDQVGFDRLVLTTGVSPRRLDGPDDGSVLYFRSAADYYQLRAMAGPDRRFLVLGGGYIGAELAAALIHEKAKVTLVTPDQVLGGSMFPPSLAQRYQGMFAQAGVHVVNGRTVQGARADGSGSGEEASGGVVVTLDDGSELRADAAVAGLGTTPVTSLAEEAGLLVDNGIVVDEHLRTSAPRVWAAGDVANYPDALLGRTRVEHVDNARHMGRAVGRSMAGDAQPYAYTPFMYSQVFGVRWEALGTLDPGLETVEVDVGDGHVVYYLDPEGTPRGVLLWALPDRLDQARRVLAGGPTSGTALATAIG